MIEIGLKYTSELTVTDAVTAIVVGSGDMPVLATPMMMALMENAAMLAVKDELPEGCTTVGGHIESSHLKPSKIGDVVKATAEVTIPADMGYGKFSQPGIPGGSTLIFEIELLGIA